MVVFSFFFYLKHRPWVYVGTASLYPRSLSQSKNKKNTTVKKVLRYISGVLLGSSSHGHVIMLFAFTLNLVHDVKTAWSETLVMP